MSDIGRCSGADNGIAERKCIIVAKVPAFRNQVMRPITSTRKGAFSLAMKPVVMPHTSKFFCVVNELPDDLTHFDIFGALSNNPLPLIEN